MNRYFSILFLLVISIYLIGQEVEYKSKEQSEYYKSKRYKPFKPLAKEEIRNYKLKSFDLGSVSNYSPYSDSLLITPCQDSIWKKIRESIRLKKFLDLLSFGEIGKIGNDQILKYEKKGQIESFIYQSYEFENRYFGEPGIWIAFSTNGGNTWEYYYSGIVQKQPLFLKWYSKIPLIKSDSVIQIEACLLRQLSAFGHPISAPTYEVVRDGVKLTFDIKKLRKDTDNDGLTDIVEAKLHTDMYKKDTDGDGVPDNLDLNPRFSSPRTDKTFIFESVINGESEKSDSVGLTESSLQTPKPNYVTPMTETVLIVTDSPDIQSVSPKSLRLIILTTKEYEKYKGKFNDELNDMYVSPLFKVDGEIDTYIFTNGINTWSTDYLVKKSKNGWSIKSFSFTIS